MTCTPCAERFPVIIVRSPLRITLGGGGTDLPGYYQTHGGLCIAAAIDKYVYITLHDTLVDELIVKYSEIERVEHALELKHPIVREALGLLGRDGRSLEIVSHADIPAGTGLGSSGAFTCALLRALHVHGRNVVTANELADQACTVEIERCHEPIGKQDQYIASFGGIQAMTFSPDGVNVQPVAMSTGVRNALEDNLLLFFTGYIRSASKVLASSTPSDADLHAVKDLAIMAKGALRLGHTHSFAKLLSCQWEAKRTRLEPNSQIDQWYTLGMANGALGGKLVGAGGGGFLLFYAEDKVSLRNAMEDAGLREVRFRFDYEGTRVVTS